MTTIHHTTAPRTDGRSERWAEGETAWFECHCDTNPVHRHHTHQQVAVLALASEEPGPESTIDGRIDDGNALTYWIGHTDGTIDLAHEDELFTGPEFFYL